MSLGAPVRSSFSAALPPTPEQHIMHGSTALTLARAETAHTFNQQIAEVSQLATIQNYDELTELFLIC